MDSFEQSKKDILNREDKSSIGKVDERIRDLCEEINKTENYYTTSSCSGRIILMIDQNKKEEGLFIKIWHEEITFEELKEELEKIKGRKRINVKFKVEPCIIHIACRDIESAKKLLEIGRDAGWKKNSIIGIDKNNKRFIVELCGTERLEFPIYDGKILVDDNFLEIIVTKSEEKMKKSWEKIKNLEKITQKSF